MNKKNVSLILNQRDLEQIDQIKKWHIENHGIELSRTQIIKKSLYNENYFLHNDFHPEEIQQFIKDFELETKNLELPFKQND